MTEELIKIVFMKHKFAHRVTLFFPGVCNLHKHSIFFLRPIGPFIQYPLRPKEEWVRPRTQWRTLDTSLRFSLLKFVEGTMSSCWAFFRLSVEMKWKSKQCKAFDKASGLFNWNCAPTFPVCGLHYSWACRQSFFVYSCMQMRLMSQYIRKWLTSLIYVSKPLITVITAILCELDWTTL